MKRSSSEGERKQHQAQRPELERAYSSLTMNLALKLEYHTVLLLGEEGIEMVNLEKEAAIGTWEAFYAMLS